MSISDGNLVPLNVYFAKRRDHQLYRISKENGSNMYTSYVLNQTVAITYAILVISLSQKDVNSKYFGLNTTVQFHWFLFHTDSRNAMISTIACLTFLKGSDVFTYVCF